MNESSFSTKNPIVIKKKSNNANIVYVASNILYCIQFAYIVKYAVLKCVGLHFEKLLQPI